MAKKAASLISTRIDERLKQQFVRSAAVNRQSPSEALRQAIQAYVREARRTTLEQDSKAIRGSETDEADTLAWIAAYGTVDDD